MALVTILTHTTPRSSLPSSARTSRPFNLGSKELTVWSTGTPRREFLYSDDLAQACIFLMNLDNARYNSLLTEDAPPLINIGTGEDIPICELAGTIAHVLGFQGTFTFDTVKPDGTSHKLMDVTRIHNLGWRHTTPLEQGIRIITDNVKEFWNTEQSGQQHPQPAPVGSITPVRDTTTHKCVDFS